MQADYIGKIVKKLGELPYRVIMFDGPWGIGKSYAVNEALEKNKNVCKISMFGLTTVNQIYHEALFFYQDYFYSSRRKHGVKT